MISLLARCIYLSCTSCAIESKGVQLRFAVTRHFNSLTSICPKTERSSVVRHDSSVSISYSAPVFGPPAEMEGQDSGVGLSQVVEILESFAPTTLAEKWDNVGLLVTPEAGTDSLISKILLTNDLTEDVMKEAVTGNFNMVISYHPPIFEAVKRVTSSTWKGRILQTCLRRDIAIYSPHTCWDAVQGGVNDWLVQAFDQFVPVSKPIFQSSEPNQMATHLAEVIVPKEKLTYLACKIQEKLGLVIIGKTPYQINSNDYVVKFTIPCETKDIVPLADVLRDFPHTFLKNEENPVLNHGMGRICTLGSPQILRKIVEAVKTHLGIPDVSLALSRGATLDTTIGSVAVCAGSGGSVLQGQKVDLIVTGEMSHHQVLDFVHQGVNVILTRHSNSERGFLKHFLSTYLNKHLARKVTLAISSTDQDPLQTA